MNLNIKNKVVAHEKDGKIIVFTNVITTKRDEKGKTVNRTLFDMQHQLRFRSVVFGCTVVSYHPEMDFTHALNSGWKEIN